MHGQTFYIAQKHFTSHCCISRFSSIRNLTERTKAKTINRWRECLSQMQINFLCRGRRRDDVPSIQPNPMRIVTLIRHLTNRQLRTGRPWWFGTGSRFRAGMFVILALNRVFVPSHQGHPVLTCSRLLSNSLCKHSLVSGWGIWHI